MSTSYNNPLIHPLSEDGHKPPSEFTYPFCYTPHPLCVKAAELAKEEVRKHEDWDKEIRQGKMLGVLVVEGGFLAAFSGTLCGKSILPFFVPPVFDLHEPGSHFQVEEKKISDINRRAKGLEHSAEYVEALKHLDSLRQTSAEEIEAFKKEMKTAKERRDNEREKSGETAEMVRESQFLKAELHRLKVHWRERIEQAHQEAEIYTSKIDALKNEAAERSAVLQQWLFHQFSFLNGRGEAKELCDIFGKTIPPAGSGECCGPKLLQYAYAQNLKPLCMAEFWLGESPKKEIRKEGNFYPACQAKCKPILGWMLQGLNVEKNPIEEQNRIAIKDLKILYKDEEIAVVDKPSGMLSVPGKENLPSVKSEIQRLFPNATGPIMVHRLDMDTSGLMVVALTDQSYHHLQNQFAKHTIVKRYTAITERDLPQAAEGIIALPLRTNPNDRPRQMVDFEHGKAAKTRYRVDGKRTILLWPETGRTHQLRVHMAHPMGMNNPIAGDRLYGKSAERLRLYADFLEFTHPTTLKRMNFSLTEEEF